MDIEILQNLEKLKELKDKEIISEEEFNLKKKELLKEKPISKDINNNFVWALAFHL